MSNMNPFPLMKERLPSLYHTDAAKAIRNVLKANFPATKFSVTAERSRNTINVRWTDGPTQARVQQLTAPFQAGHFDGMTDSYEYRQGRVVEVDGKQYEPDVRFLFTTREISAKLARQCVAQIALYFGIPAEYVPTVRDNGSLEVTTAQQDMLRERTGRMFWHEILWQASKDRSKFTRTTH